MWNESQISQWNQRQWSWYLTKDNIIILQMNNKIFSFQNTNTLAQALTNKIHELEYQSKKGVKYPFGNNEDFVGIGQMILEFYFSDYLIQRGWHSYPNKESQIKKSSDLVLLRQRLLSERNLADIALSYKIDNIVQVGNQIGLKKNPKILAETLKAIIAAQYYDSGYDLDHLREVVQPILKQVLDKGQGVPIVELKQNPKSAFLEFVNGCTNLKPKVSVEWKKDSSQNGNPINVYQVQLELSNLLSITRVGINKRNTEQIVYREALKMLKQIQINQSNSLEQQNYETQPLKIKNQDKKSTEEITILDELDTSSIESSQFYQFSDLRDNDLSLLENQDTLGQKVESLLEKFAL
ncbi:unnamed protein product (macronuclear) [Paramecium tetraurelia]|uniref:RNase III domain-containing protein n=1 Tax=Paramecium tetraurelia TaxID=5888 RepID=A0CGR8_PARTE|nr:uncharacterized protein GSPATT00007425001 [Paramecium tetraurelia]CAK69985.1 unnamed protein product [Paramecium tetraurelia]|eukprot:XP_001437382.1 hypothetical protein (macronuclear) [Paramecium tetraurelia strain d4-2]